MKGIRRIVAAHKKLERELPLVHTSRAKNLQLIVAGHKLKATPCPVYKEKLLYLFYGRPAYRFQQGKKPSDPIPVLPICFVFQPYNSRRQFRRVLATDSGGVANGFCRPDLKKSDLQSLSLVATNESAQKLVSLLYASNGNYFDGRPRATVPEFSGTIGDKLHLHVKKLYTQGDDRRSAIEFQSSQGVQLRGKLWAIILPGDLLEGNDALKHTIKNVWKCQTLGYRFTTGTNMPAYFDIVRQKVADLLESKKLL